MKKQKYFFLRFAGTFLMLLSLSSWAANPTYLCRITNGAQVSCNVWEFDVTIAKTGGGTLSLAQWQLGILMNPLVIPSGGIINVAPVPGSSDGLNANARPGPANFTYDAVKNCITVTPVTPTGTNWTNIPNSPPVRLCRIRVSCTLPFIAATTPNPTWNFAVATGYPTKIFALVGTTNTDITVAGSHIYLAPYNPTFTGSWPDPVAQTVTSDVTEFCNLPGAGATISLSSTQNGYTYYLYSNGSLVTGAGGVIFGTGSAQSFTTLATGSVMTVKSPSCAGMVDMSNAINLTPLAPVAASVSIVSTSGTTVPEGVSATYSASPVNGGAIPGYQWYVNGTPDYVSGFDATYTYIPLDGDQVYCEMYTSEACVTPETATATSNTITMVVVAPATWTGAINTLWNVPGNWSTASVPGAYTSVTIPFVANTPQVNLDLATPAACYNLTINLNSSVYVSPGKALTVNGTIINNAGTSGLVVESDGSLIQNSAVVGTVERSINAWTAENGWHLLSSPVTSQAIQPEFVPSQIPTPTTTEDFYAWWEPANLWVNFKNKTTSPTWIEANVLNGTPGGDNFIPGKGYLVAYQNTTTKHFTGTLNTGDFSVTGLTISSPPTGTTYYGWHLLGNPYSSAITWSTGWTRSNIAATAKIWNQGGSYSDISAGNPIPATQGFMVEVTSATGSLTIPATARTHNAQPWYKSTENPYIKLVAHNPGSQTYQESVLSFNNQSLPGYDPEFDSRFLPGYAPLFYSVDGSEHLSTNVLPDLSTQMVIPFNFVKTEGTTYTIEAEKISNVPPPVYLTDLKLNYTQNLVSNPVYTFTSNVGDDPARFLLSFLHVGIGENNLNNNSIYTYENYLYCVNPGKARLEVFSLTGQKLISQDIDSQGLYKTIVNVPTAYYVVRVTTGTKVVVTKVFIKS